jgi:4'-phosphopantetheinyl transferase
MLNPTQRPNLADLPTCRVWWAARSAARDQHRHLLDTDEAARWQHFRHDDDRARTLVGIALAKTVLAGMVGAPPADIRFDRTCPRCERPHGKPRLAEPAAPIHLSVSHSGDRICVAVTTCAPVGVDVEAISALRHLERTARAVLTDAEFRRWTTLPPGRQDTELVRAWTRKESLLKATGHGLALPMDGIELVRRDGVLHVQRWPDGETWPRAHLHDLSPGPGYLACLTILAPGPVSVVELDGTGLLERPVRGVGHGVTAGRAGRQDVLVPAATTEAAP